MECLELLVGISREECDCRDGSEHSFNITTSESGFYIDEMLDLDLAKVGPCKEEDQYTYADRQIQLAKEQVKIDIVHSITTSEKGLASHGKTQGWRGNFGDRTFPKTVTASTYSGIRIDSKNLKGSVLKIKKAYIVAKATGDVLVGGKNSLGEQTIVQSTVTIASANVWQEITSWANTELPMYSNEDRKFSHFFYIKDNENPAANKKACAPCSGHAPWTKYLTTTGFKATDLDAYLEELEGGGYVDSEYYCGLRLEIELSCSIEDNMCDILGDSKVSLGQAVALNACMKIIESAGTDMHASLFNNVQDAKLQQMHGALQEQYVALIDYLAKSQEWGPCYPCNPVMTKRTILK